VNETGCAGDCVGVPSASDGRRNGASESSTGIHTVDAFLSD